jgi:hypothetical protein
MKWRLVVRPYRRSSRVGRLTALLATGAVLALPLAAAPATSLAASVQVEGGVIKFTAASGELNRVSGNPAPEFGFLDFRDDGAPLSAGPGCEDLGDVVRCEGFDAEVRVLDGADRVRLEHFGTLTTIWGGEGSDVIHGGSGAGSTTIHGEAGADILSTSNNGADAVVTGGTGDDALTIGEATGGHFAGGNGDDHIRYIPLAESASALTATALQSATEPIIDGGNGDDLIEAGLLPTDEIDGGRGADTLRYFGGGTIDAEASHLETVISLGGHVIFGTRRADRLISLGGSDTIFALGGDDLIDVRNGVPDDIVDCGAGHDEVRADPGDSIASNCELQLGPAAS